MGHQVVLHLGSSSDTIICFIDCVILLLLTNFYIKLSEHEITVGQRTFSREKYCYVSAYLNLYERNVWVRV